MKTIRFAKLDDADALLAIYGPYIETPITFACELPSAAAFRV